MEKYYRKIISLAIIGIPIGFVVGVIDTIFGKTLINITKIRDENPIYFLPFLAIIGVLIVFSYRRYGKDSVKGMGLIFEVAQGKEEKIPLRLIPFIIISTWLTHLFGGSAGREGVAVQVGATFSNFISRKVKIENSSKVFLIVGMASGFAGLFQTPIAAVLFATEVLIAGAISYNALIPAITGAFTAAATSHFLGLEKFKFTINPNVIVDFNILIKLVFIGIIIGLVGSFFAIALKYSKSFFAKKIENPIKRIFYVGLVLSFILLILHNGRYSGLGTNLIDASFHSGQIYSYDFILKFILTIITLAIGFQGGEVTPLFAIGASLGVVLAPIFNLPLELVAAIGYIGVFGSATNTFFAPIFIGAEVFGYQNIPYFFIAMAFAYIFNFNKSIYSLQQNSEL